MFTYSKINYNSKLRWSAKNS